MKRLMLLAASVLLSTGVVAQYNFALRSPNSDSNAKSSTYSILNSASNSKSDISGWDRVYFSFGGGGWVGTNAAGYRYSYFSLLPTVGYKVTPEFLLGMNIFYSKYNFPDYGYSYTQFGYAPFARYYFEQLFFQIEYDLIKSPNYSTGAYESDKYYERLLVGIGYRTDSGGRSSINVMAMYDLTYQANTSPFQSPFVYRVFFSF